jgi:hypothetical protein
MQRGDNGSTHVRQWLAVSGTAVVVATAVVAMVVAAKGADPQPGPAVPAASAESTASTTSRSTPSSTPPSSSTAPPTPTPEERYVAALEAESVSANLNIGLHNCAVLRDGGLPPGHPGAPAPGMTAAQFLAENRLVGVPGSIAGHAAELAVQILCPDQQPVLDQALSGTYPVARHTAFPDGTYRVGLHIDPGTYRSATVTPQGVITDCYWERADAAGNTLDNNFVVGGTEIIVTIQPTDAVFTTSGCPAWTRVS